MNKKEIKTEEHEKVLADLDKDALVGIIKTQDKIIKLKDKIRAIERGNYFIMGVTIGFLVNAVLLMIMCILKG